MTASCLQENGIKYSFSMSEKKDLQRNIVRSEHCTILIPELEFEIPVSTTNKGIFTTIEGLLIRVFDDLSSDQVVRKIQHPELFEQIETFLSKAKKVTGISDEENISPKCTIIFKDDSGNSFVENPHAPFPDHKLRVDYYVRSDKMTEKLGFMSNANESKKENSKSVGLEPLIEEPLAEDPSLIENVKLKNSNKSINQEMSTRKDLEKNLDLSNEVLSIPTNCSECNSVSEANFKTVDIPFFKNVLIMASVCENCGYKSNEVKSGCGFSEKGQVIQLKILEDNIKYDLSRDVLKSETCSIKIPELNFEIGRGAIEGKFTTIEGILTDVQRIVKMNPFTLGDSSGAKTKNQIEQFCEKVDKICQGDFSGFKQSNELIIEFDDPAGNSYVQNLNAPDIDEQLKITEYERSFDQNEQLGLNDIKVEDYC